MIQKILYPLITAILILVFLEFLIHMQWISSYLLPAPSQIAITLQIDFLEYFNAAQETLSAAVAGLLLSILIGVSTAMLLSTFAWAENALYPYAVFFQTVPLISIAPLLVIWFGFGFNTVMISSWIASVFPIIANTFSGLRSVDPDLENLFRLYKANRFDKLFYLRFPYAIPQIFVGIRIATGLSLIGAIVGEFIAGGGLGGLIDVARTQQRIDKVFAAVIICSFSGVILLAFWNLVAKIVLKRWNWNQVF